MKSRLLVALVTLTLLVLTSTAALPALADLWYNLFFVDCNDIGFGIDPTTAPQWYMDIPFTPRPEVVLVNDQYNPTFTHTVALSRFDHETEVEHTYISDSPWFLDTGLEHGRFWVSRVLIADSDNVTRTLLFPPIARPDPPDAVCGTWRTFMPVVLRSSPPTER